MFEGRRLESSGKLLQSEGVISNHDDDIVIFIEDTDRSRFNSFSEAENVQSNIKPTLLDHLNFLVIEPTFSLAYLSC